MKKSKKIKKDKKLISQENEPNVKSQVVLDLRLTKFELIHLRDLMGVLLPPEGFQTLSQALAVVEGRATIESMLWNKISKLCIEANLPIDAEAPDYIVMPTSPPPMGIFQLNQELDSQTQSEAGFLPPDNLTHLEEDENE